MAVRNFGRNIRFVPRRRVMPRTVDELATIIRESKRVRAVGAAHSWSHVAEEYVRLYRSMTFVD